MIPPPPPDDGTDISPNKTWKNFEGFSWTHPLFGNLKKSTGWDLENFWEEPNVR